MLTHRRNRRRTSWMAPPRARWAASAGCSANGSSTRSSPRASGHAARALRRFRIFALEHHTLSASPATNALELARLLPVDAKVHLVSHSRGGLIGELLCRGGFDDAQLKVFRRDDRETAVPGELASPPSWAVSSLASDCESSASSASRARPPALCWHPIGSISSCRCCSACSSTPRRRRSLPWRWSRPRCSRWRVAERAPRSCPGSRRSVRSRPTRTSSIGRSRRSLRTSRSSPETSGAATSCRACALSPATDSSGRRTTWWCTREPCTRDCPARSPGSRTTRPPG